MPTINKCLFPIAGYGTRFLPATKAMPKEMLPIVNKPLLQYGVEEAWGAGLSNIVLVTGRGKHAITDYFDVSYELESHIAGTPKEASLQGVRRLLDACTFAYTRQKEMRGLGDAILTGQHLIGNESFGVVLADDLCFAPLKTDSVMAHLVALHQAHGCSVVALEEVAKEKVNQYGIIQGKSIADRVYQIEDMVEKPSPEDAPSNLAVVGRYILTPDIFDVLAETPPAQNGEVQITDALKVQARAGKVIGYQLEGRRFDCGSVEGFVAATNYCYERFYLQKKTGL